MYYTTLLRILQPQKLEKLQLFSEFQHFSTCEVHLYRGMYTRWGIGCGKDQGFPQVEAPCRLSASALILHKDQRHYPSRAHKRQSHDSKHGALRCRACLLYHSCNFRLLCRCAQTRSDPHTGQCRRQNQRCQPFWNRSHESRPFPDRMCNHYSPRRCRKFQKPYPQGKKSAHQISRFLCITRMNGT